MIVSPEELTELKEAFSGGSGDVDERSDVDLCVGCSRKVTYGDFGMDHVSFTRNHVDAHPGLTSVHVDARNPGN